MIRIANGQGFWGDSLEAPVEQVRRGPIDYLTLDYLAEVTMSILQKQRTRDSQAGYARDFVDLIARVLPDLKDRRIRVNAISPGSIDTPAATDLLASSAVGEQRRKMVSTSVPLGRFGRPDEVAKAVVFLASDDSSYITGTELFVDGGFA